MSPIVLMLGLAWRSGENEGLSSLSVASSIDHEGYQMPVAIVLVGFCWNPRC